VILLIYSRQMSREGKAPPWRYLRRSVQSVSLSLRERALCWC
jgi:hypothetical protein